MSIIEILLINFRNYEKLKINFNKNINVIIGNNAEGKTNILESIYFLSITKSYRTIDEKKLIKDGEKKFKLTSKIVDNKVIKRLAIEYEKNNKKTFINNNCVKKISEYLTNFNVVLVSPDDIEIIKGTPNERRNLLNISISQISKKYIYMNNEYNKLLKMRNDYLKLLYTNSISDNRYFEILTEKLVERAASIFIERKNILDLINIKVKKIFKDITGNGELSIKYITNIQIDDFNEKIIKKKLFYVFNENLNKEMCLGSTIYGPHRDDLVFEINEKDLKYFGSQGQQKIAIISFKLALLSIYEEITGSKPVLLLDDIFSELDKFKKNNLISYIKDAGQVIITSNDLKDINKSLLVNAKVFQIKNKKIIEKGEKNGK